jgi:hypothetical protein
MSARNATVSPLSGVKVGADAAADGGEQAAGKPHQFVPDKIFRLGKIAVEFGNLMECPTIYNRGIHKKPP